MPNPLSPTTPPNPVAAPAPVQLSRTGMVLAYASGAFGLSYMSMCGFLVPLRAHELGASVEEIGLLVGAGAFSAMLTAVPAGAFSDRFGSRRTFIAGAVTALIAAVGLALAPSVALLFVLQLVRGFPQVLGWVGAMTCVPGLGDARSRAGIAGRFSLATNIAGVASPTLIGVAAQTLGIAPAFWCVALYCLLFTIVGVLMTETHTPPAVRHTSFTGYRPALAMLRFPAVQAIMLLSVARLAAQSGWAAFFPLFLVEHGTPTALAGTVISVSGIASAANSTLAGRLSRTGRSHLVVGLFACGGATAVALSPLAAGIPLAYLPALAIGASQGVTLPLLLALLSQYTDPHLRGVAMGAREGINQATVMVTPVATGIVLGAAGPIGFASGGLLVALAVAAAAVLHRRETRSG